MRLQGVAAAKQTAALERASRRRPGSFRPFHFKFGVYGVAAGVPVGNPVGTLIAVERAVSAAAERSFITFGAASLAAGHELDLRLS